MSPPSSGPRSPDTRTTSVGINSLLLADQAASAASTCPLHVDGASGGFVWPFLYPDSEWDFRLEQVRSINVSGHKFGLVYPGIGWLIFREKSDLAPDLVFEENYLGKTDATFTLNFSTGSAMVLAQYYNLVRYGRAGYTYVMRNMQTNARILADKLEEIGRFHLIGRDQEQLPLAAFKLADRDLGYDEFDIAWQLSAERGWMVPAYTLPPRRPERNDHARPGQGNTQPRTHRHPRPRHRRRLRHARPKRTRSRLRTRKGRYRPGTLTKRNSDGTATGRASGQMVPPSDEVGAPYTTSR